MTGRYLGSAGLHTDSRTSELETVGVAFRCGPTTPDALPPLGGPSARDGSRDRSRAVGGTRAWTSCDTLCARANGSSWGDHGCPLCGDFFPLRHCQWGDPWRPWHRMDCSQGHHSCFERREPVARTLQIPINRVWGLTQVLPVSESVSVLPDHRGYVWHPGGLFGRLVSLSVTQWLITNQPSAGGARRSYNFLVTLRK
jgi:hypothetical protein